MWSDACKSILFSLDGWMEYLSACLASVGQPCLSFSMTGRASGAKHTPCQPKGRWTGFWWSTAGCKCRGIKRGSVKRSIAVTGDQAAMAGWVSLLFFSCISKHGEQCWSMLKLSWFRSAHLVCPITMTGFDVHWIAFRFTLSCHSKILQMLLLVSSCTSDWTCWGASHVTRNTAKCSWKKVWRWAEGWKRRGKTWGSIDFSSACFCSLFFWGDCFASFLILQI